MHRFLHLQSVDLGYQGTDEPIIFQATITAKPGVITLITGPNGAGKSTLLAGLMGFANVWLRGSVSWNGAFWQDVSTPVRARNGFLYVPQHSLEIPGLPAHQLVLSALKARGQILTLDEVISLVQAAYQRVGLVYDPDNKGLHVGLSGGQKRRAELAQVLLFTPQIILLDELDAHLDTQGQELLLDTLVAYIRAHPDSIILMTTHSATLAERIVRDGVPYERIHIQQGGIVTGEGI